MADRPHKRTAYTRQRWDPRFSIAHEYRPMDAAETNAVVDCGWGRLIFANTFENSDKLVDVLRDERSGSRDIAFYLADPHVVLAKAPQELFLDPSHTYRLWMSQYRPARQAKPPGFVVRRMRTLDDAEAMNTIYAAHQMVQIDPKFAFNNRMSKHLTYLVAEDDKSGEILGTVTGVDHLHAFDDPENGSSLWCLAVSPNAVHPGLGEALVRHLAEHFAARGRVYMDLSVMHDNDQAIALYEKLGFRRLQIFAVKTKNTINERLFAGPAVKAELNPYAMIIVNEARRRGIHVEVLDEEGGFFRLSQGGRSIVCREALCQLTDAVAMSRCDDKAVTRRILERAGLAVPGQTVAGDAEDNAAFLEQYGSVVIKPARGEQGRGISVDIRDPDEIEKAIGYARQQSDTVLLEEYCTGIDLRIIVIDYQMVAAAIRKPAEVIGTGRHTIEKLIEKQSRRRSAATGGESRIPIDGETERCVRDAGYEMDTVLAEGEKLVVRKTANLHTGGSIHDVTDRIHHRVIDAAIKAARAIQIPVVGLDFLVPNVDSEEYVIIEANERPGLANHEPQPTAERFIDLLFPQTAAP